MDQPEILATQEVEQLPQDSEEELQPKDSQDFQHSIAATSLNFVSGLSNMIMVDILQNIDCENIRSQICYNQEAGRQALQNLKECKKLFAGDVFKSGQAWLQPEVFEAQLHRTRKKKENEKELAKKKSNERAKRKQACLKASSEISELKESKWSVTQLKALINYKSCWCKRK